MISFENDVFRLDTQESSYWFHITKYGHLEHVFYGPRLNNQDIEGLIVKRSATYGSCVSYTQEDLTYCLDNMCLEWSGTGCGDYRQSPIEAKMPDGTFISDFVYVSHEVIVGAAEMETLPCAYGAPDECQTLAVTLEDKSNAVSLILYFTVFEKTNVIARRAVVKNSNNTPLVIRRIMSMSVDLPDKGYKLVTFDGGWIKEAHKHERPINYGIYINSSTTGASSNRHNAGFLIAQKDANENYGEVYGFNLIYSGNHFALAELSNCDLLRVQQGINPHCFEWTLHKDEAFETPQAVLTFSNKGYNGMSANFHDFINNNIVRGEYKNAERPVLLNNWEACFFKFTQSKLLRLSRQAKRLGVELFVLDDGWFGNRNTDTAGLGDYAINRKKLPWGMAHFAEKIEKQGLKFGLWFEPEMVNEDSDLFRAHPEYAVKTPGKHSTMGRNQLVLDLCNKDVRDYIVKNVTNILDSAKISYVKWDMNRHISDAFSPTLSNQGEFYHKYIMGLYDILRQIFYARPHILLESCSSGGNRFDLGMLCFSPQVWTSDDTDPVERLDIQQGISYLYPLSTMGAHVSEAPHQQTLRNTPLSTRFNAAAFGCLGYELDLKYLTPAQKREVKSQIAYYKQHRRTLQYGRFYRFDAKKDNKVHWQCVSKDLRESIAGFYQTRARASEGYDFLPLTGLDEQNLYYVKTRPQNLYISQFGRLVKHILPVQLNPDGPILRFINRHYALPDCTESYEGCGDMLNFGLRLNNQFMGSYYNTQTRLLSDFGSNLYTVEKIEDRKEMDGK